MSIEGMPSIQAKSHKIGTENSILPNAISIILISVEYFFVKRSVSERNNAHRADKTTQIKLPPQLISILGQSSC